MAHFYGGVHGNRGEATRCGSKGSGISTFASGWNLGGRANMWNDSDGKDSVTVYLTAGSSGSSRTVGFGSFTREQFDILSERQVQLNEAIQKVLNDSTKVAVNG